jgi:hypothetical protein
LEEKEKVHIAWSIYDSAVSAELISAGRICVSKHNMNLTLLTINGSKSSREASFVVGSIDSSSTASKETGGC